MTEKQSELLSAHIRAEMAGEGNSLSFARFMELALYHPAYGYYNAEDFNLGKSGDFTTAPELSPLFAKCLAKQAKTILAGIQATAILELGAGTGRLAGDLLQALHQANALPTHYFIYEISENLRKKQQAYLQTTCPQFYSRIHWLSQLPTDFSGLIIANEVLDALPVHCVHFTETGVKEKCLAYQNNHFIWQLAPPTHPQLEKEAMLLKERYALPAGYETEINLNLAPFLTTLINGLTQGIILFIDYGYGEKIYYHPKRSSGTLTSFYQHQQNNDPLQRPGLQDITAHVDFTRVIEIASTLGCELLGYTSQASFLLANGLLELAAEEEKNLSPAETFKLHQAIKTLTMPHEMGERVNVMALGKNTTFTLATFGLNDRRRDL